MMENRDLLRCYISFTLKKVFLKRHIQGSMVDVYWITDKIDKD